MASPGTARRSRFIEDTRDFEGVWERLNTSGVACQDKRSQASLALAVASSEYGIDTESEAPPATTVSRRKTPDITLSLASVDDLPSTQQSPLHRTVTDKLSFLRRSSTLSPPPVPGAKHSAITLDASSVYSRSTGGRPYSDAGSNSALSLSLSQEVEVEDRKTPGALPKPTIPAVRFVEPPLRPSHDAPATQPLPPRKLKKQHSHLLKRPSLHGLKTVASRLHLKPSVAKLDKKIATLEAELEKAKAERASISISSFEEAEVLPSGTTKKRNAGHDGTEALPNPTKKRKAGEKGEDEGEAAAKKRKNGKYSASSSTACPVAVGPGPVPGRTQYQQVCSGAASGQGDVPPVPPIPPRYRGQAARMGGKGVKKRKGEGEGEEEEWKGWDEEVF